jgi:uncharacterized membrane protein YphA (DoxX/SURF4 family)
MQPESIAGSGAEKRLRAPSARVGFLDVAAVAARWLLGAEFVYMGGSKVLHPDLFLKLVRQYDLTSNAFFLNLVAGWLPWFEVVCGLLLLAGVAVRGTALMSLLMLLGFTPLILVRALSLAAAHAMPLCLVKFDCGCGAGPVFACNKLVENCLFIVFSLWLLTGRGRQFTLWFSPLAAVEPPRSPVPPG